MTLKIPDGGLLLEGSSGKDPKVPPQAFAITLSDNVIESMIKCVQNGENLQLALGNTPTLLYGSQSHRLTPPPDSFPLDLYLTQPYESTREAKRIPLTGSLFEKPSEMAPPAEALASKKVSDDSKTKATTSNKSSTSSGLDSDLETLQNGLAAHDASRERTRMISKPPATKKGAGAAKGKLLPGYTSTARSLSTSPALNAVRSPSETPGFSASQQVVERKKEQRSTLVHELAVKDRPLDYLQKKWMGKQDELQPTLEKVADYIADTKMWTMKKAYWKELDVWNYDYDTQKERQTAIDNAIRQYDKQRMSASEPEWQKLLPKEERGKGKCLSVLQASLAKKNTTEALTVDMPKEAGEAMTRTGSNPLPGKAKKPSAQEAQAKRLLGKSKPSSAAQKPSPTKTKAATATKANSGRVLSQEFIENSDSSGDEVPIAQAKPKPTPKPVPKPAPATKETVVVKPKPVIREPVKKQPKQPQQPTKRPRDEDESSSSSGTPLSKRLKDKQALHPSSTLKRRPADANQNSRGTTNTGSTLKNKATSPTKSSPLASSPPTNASDIENETARQVIKKRKAEAEARSMPSKRSAPRQVSSDVLSQAQTFKVFYQKYEALHYEISALDNPPDEKLANLLDMRGRLQSMKNEIYKQYASDKE